MPIERDRPRAHLVVDDFFGPAALTTIFAELPKLERRLKPGLVRDIGHDGQSVFFEHPRRQNRAVWLHDPSKTLRLFREQLWSGALVDTFASAREPLFQIIPNCWTPHLQVSSYMTGDHYDFHEDEGAGVNLTAIVFLAKRPERVRGGHLVLAYGGEETTVHFRHNRLVIFPSKTLHRVTRVRVASIDVRDARISLQSWLTYGRPKTKAKAKAKPRAAEADRPTFLLAEEPIIAAAQAIFGEREQSPEEMYWGAFYLTRILSANLRALAAAVGLVLGPIRIRRRDELEVYGTARIDEKRARVGFALRGPDASPFEALRLFVEHDRSSTTRFVPPGADEHEVTALLRRLLVSRTLTS